MLPEATCRERIAVACGYNFAASKCGASISRAPWRHDRAVGAAGGDHPPPAPKDLFARQTLCRLLDELGDRFGLRNVDRVASLRLGDRRTRTLGHRTLRGGRDHAIVSGDQVPARLDLPSGGGDAA